ncbi:MULTISPECIES: hypothetical protein [Streptomyces]|uniref:hypothetical protein n=1 Tax=Streptomyces TaxID=1883 RepID=UPI000B04C927|nr:MULTISPECIES: hypothetical protein [Streptomyces]MCH0558242.1 hypothetical protein [Streptomyces sp. MUM 16J]
MAIIPEHAVTLTERVGRSYGLRVGLSVHTTTKEQFTGDVGRRALPSAIGPYGYPRGT